jgi:hypothetical protein
MQPMTLGARANNLGRATARFILVVACAVYASAKFTGAQFVIPGYLRDTPVADLSGLDLTWAFFARSPLYSSFVAIGQLVAAALLAFDRTARLGAVVLLPITTNIAIVNFGYDIGLDTLVLSVLLLVLNLYLLVGEFYALKKCFWDDMAAGQPPREFLSLSTATVARGTGFVLVILGIFFLFRNIMNSPAGGQKAIAGDWLVESVSIDGRPADDPAVGASWLWICFEPNGIFGVRTKRWIFLGKYDVDQETKGFAIRYDPEPRLPVYPGQSLDRYKPTLEEEKRHLGESLEGFQWPMKLSGTYRKEGDKLFVTTMDHARRIEWVLVRYSRPTF